MKIYSTILYLPEISTHILLPENKCFNDKFRVLLKRIPALRIEIPIKQLLT
jgi:hypothetical protein